MRLAVTPAIRQLMDDVGHKELDEVGAEDATVAWNDLKQMYARSDYAARYVPLRLVCKGSSIAFDRPGGKCNGASSSQKSEELVKHLEELRKQLDQKLYDRMVRDVTARERHAEAARGTSLAVYKEQMRFGAHVVSMMAVFFLFGYFASSRVVASDAFRVLCGALGMFAAMVMETMLFIIRDTKQHDGGAEKPGEVLLLTQEKQAKLKLA
jgi:hypothetical protein